MRLRLFTIWLLTLFLRGVPAAARDFAWQELLDPVRLPTLAPYDLRHESGPLRFDDQGRPLVRRDAENRVILLEAPGPGVLLRFYSSTPAGKFTFLVDGAPEPLVAAETAELFRWHYEIEIPRSRGEPEPTQPFPFLWPLAERAQWVGVAVIPIPFAHSLTVLSDHPVADNNYAFTWLALPPGSPPPPAVPEPEVVQAAAAAARRAADPMSVTPDLREVRASLRLSPGQSAPICALGGAGTIRSLRVTLDPANPLLERQLILRAWWDGAEEPSVQVPLGDLCGRHWGQGRPGLLGGALIRPGARRGMPPLEHTLYVRFPMPFSAGARLELQLLGDSYVRQLDCRVLYSPDAPAPDAGRFCAAFLVGDWLPGQTLSLADLSGPGKLVAWAVANWDYPTDHPWDWRQDFDPVLIVDGEEVARGNGLLSLHYGGGGPLETHALPAFPMLGNAPRAVTRHLLLDAEPFVDSLQLRLERFPGREAGCRYSSLAAWYAPAGSAPRLPVWSAPDLYWPAFRRRDAIEAEDLVSSATAHLGEIVVVTDEPGRFFLSGRRMVNLVPHSPQARFVFRLPVAEPGRYRLFTRTFHSLRSQSLWEMTVNGIKSEHVFQGFYAKFPGVGLAQSELDNWGVFDLSPEKNRVVLMPQADYARRQGLADFLYCVDAFLLQKKH